MERIQKRAAQAARVTARKIAKRKEFIKNGKEWMIRMNNQRADAAERKLVEEEKKRRIEAWKRGPLTPRPDVGRLAITYGTLPPEIMQRPNEYEARRPDWFHLQPGDRVVVIHGRAKGKIAEIEHLDEQRCVVFLKGLRINMEVPPHVKAELGGKNIILQNLSVHIKDVKLVYPLPDAETGVVSDVIIDKLDPIAREWDRHKRELGKGYRVIHGTTTIIPWPETVEEDATAYAADTPEEIVAQQTFNPSLVKAPMPLPLINELRNKYSKFRTRYDFETRERIEKKARRVEERKELIQTMRTPLQELAELRAKQKAERQRDLTFEQLAKIGEIMANEAAAKASPKATASAA